MIIFDLLHNLNHSETLISIGISQIYNTGHDVVSCTEITKNHAIMRSTMKGLKCVVKHHLVYIIIYVCSSFLAILIPNTVELQWHEH